MGYDHYFTDKTLEWLLDSDVATVSLLHSSIIGQYL